MFVDGWEVSAIGLANRHQLHVFGADLKGADLKGAYLVNANLRGADLRGAYLVNADLEGANLDGANLDGANLDGANLANAALCNADFNDAIITFREHLVRVQFLRCEDGMIPIRKAKETLMLVLTRKPEEGIQIGDDIYVHVLWVRSGRVALGFEAPYDTNIRRLELEVDGDEGHNDDTG